MRQPVSKKSVASSRGLAPDGTAAPVRPPHAPLNRLLDLARHLFEVPAAFVWRDDATQGVRLPAARGFEPVRPVGASAFCAAVQAAEDLLAAEDVAADHPFAADPLLAAAGARFAVGVPLHRDADPVGVLVLLDTRPRALSPAQQATLQRLAGVVADTWALEDSRQFLSSINRNISEGIYRSTPQGRILYANEALARMFGYDTPEELLEVWVPRLYRDPRRREELIERTERERGFKGEEAEFVRKDGSTFWALISCTAALNAAGHIFAYEGAISDITARRRYEHELIEAKEQALAVARHKSAFLADMSHEIRTPLTAIIGFADILAEEADEEMRELAQLVRQSGEGLVRMLNSVLTLARLDGEAALSLSAEPVDVVALAQQVLDLFRIRARQRGLALNLVAPEAPLVVRIDAGALSRIVTNLVSNALKFTEDGHVTVIIEARAAHLELRVEDTGVGISEAFLPRLFGAFHQEQSGLTPDQEGSGLGLAITQRLVALLGGTIDVESEKGRGTTFTVRLPSHTPIDGHGY